MPLKLIRWVISLAALAVAASVTGCVHVEKPPPVHPPHIEKPPPLHPEKPPPIHPPPLHVFPPEGTGFNGIVDKAAATAAGVQKATPAQVRQGVLSATCELLADTAKNGSFPSIQDVKTSLIIGLGIKLFAALPTTAFTAMAQTLRNQLAQHVLLSSGLVSQENVDRGLTALGCETVTGE
jgi:hypothetical protein